MKKIVKILLISLFFSNLALADEFEIRGKLNQVVESLPEKDREFVKEQVKTTYLANQSIREKLKASRDQEREVLKAEKFDEKAFEKTALDQRMLMVELNKNRTILVTNVAPLLAAKDRYLILSAIEFKKNVAKEKFKDRLKNKQNKAS